MEFIKLYLFEIIETTSVMLPQLVSDALGTDTFFAPYNSCHTSYYLIHIVRKHFSCIPCLILSLYFSGFRVLPMRFGFCFTKKENSALCTILFFKGKT